ncbi:Prolyl 4-hydroxylase 5 [Cocos nucifera]|uniref:Prolyl 4-hydroxylase 5 n=1 Tax=Cocos nucifera TaxID=13894 RepID=A0A8K0IKU0_COCNU|nr:Prolyl 4-hydroxylase 5 [Cocos nucifera]
MAFSRPSLMARGVRHPRMFSNRPSSLYALAFTVFLMLSAVLLILLALGIFSLPVPSAPKGADIRHDRYVYETTTTYLSDGNGLGKRGPQWTEVVSWEPRAFIYHNFLSKEECEFLIELAKPHLVKSTVVDSTTGKSIDSRVRTSSGMFFKRGQNKIIQDIEKRIADYTFIPVEHGEGLQVLHYEVGQKYEPHFDYFLDEFNIKNGGQREHILHSFLVMLSCLDAALTFALSLSLSLCVCVCVYSSDVEEGGETVFPYVKVNSSSLPWYNELSECGKKGLSVKPKMGDALLFWSMKPDAVVDPLSLHGACPVIKGNKWSCTKWMHIHKVIQRSGSASLGAPYDMIFDQDICTSFNDPDISQSEI